MISSSLYTAENRLYASWSKKIAVSTIMFFCSPATSSTSMSTSIKSNSNSSSLSIFSPESTSSYLNSSLSYTKFVCSCHNFTFSIDPLVHLSVVSCYVQLSNGHIVHRNVDAAADAAFLFSMNPSQYFNRCLLYLGHVPSDLQFLSFQAKLHFLFGLKF